MTISDLATCALNRMDEKGESIEAAAENVTGGNREEMAAVIRHLRGEPAAPAPFSVHIILNDKGSPAGKLADAELHFQTGVLAGLKLVGFAVWQRRTGDGLNVVFPARQYSVNGERRSFSLLRPMADPSSDRDLRDLILAAYEAEVLALPAGE